MGMISQSQSDRLIIFPRTEDEQNEMKLITFVDIRFLLTF